MIRLWTGFSDCSEFAFKEWTRERVPLDWAMTQNNLGVALQTLGEREHNIEYLHQAKPAIESAYALLKQAGCSQCNDDFDQQLHALNQLIENFQP